ncbi:MAG: hypothetical protein QCI82_00850 [Candidatus Thermoplasmatota archaeon]|nr:hypothetical protein [Candidatus Thermoplasmatota archaeon]
MKFKIINNYYFYGLLLSFLSLLIINCFAIIFFLIDNLLDDLLFTLYLLNILSSIGLIYILYALIKIPIKLSINKNIIFSFIFNKIRIDPSNIKKIYYNELNSYTKQYMLIMIDNNNSYIIIPALSKTLKNEIFNIIKKPKMRLTNVDVKKLNIDPGLGEILFKKININELMNLIK